LTPYALVAIGASWGGLSALERLLGGLPADFPSAIVIAQHRTAQPHVGDLAGILARHTPLAVSEVEDKEPILPGHVHLAPADYHVLVEPGSLALSVEEPVAFSRPSIDVMLASAADAYGAHVIGIVLTGANADGAAGLARIRARGGVALVQDPRTAERAAMPEAAIAAATPHRVLPLDAMPALLVAMCGGGGAGGPPGGRGRPGRPA